MFRPPDPARPSRLTWVSSRGPLTAVVAAVITLVLFGLLGWILESDQQPPAETVPAPTEGGVGYYAPGYVPEGYVLVEAYSGAFMGSRLMYLTSGEGVWLPDDGAFVIDNPIAHRVGIPEDPTGRIREILTAVPGAVEVEIAGRRGVLLESQFSQGGVSAPLIDVLAEDGAGGFFEITSLGMSREEVLAIAEGVERISAQSFLDLASSLDWELRVVAQHDSFSYQVPSLIEMHATDVLVVLGADVLTPRLYRAPDTATEVTTEDGSIVDADPEPRQSRIAFLFLQIPADSVEEARVALDGAALSPRLAQQQIEDYIDHVRTGAALSEEPYIIQAPPGPSPQFDTSRLGEELPLVPATSSDEVPTFTSSLSMEDAAVASEERPAVVIGAVHEPDFPSDRPTMMVWFTEAGGFCETIVDQDGWARSCGEIPLARFGITLDSSGSGPDSLAYAVPLDTSVVQIVTDAGTYWQRPAGGYGLIVYERSLDRPSEIVAFNAEGNELGRWAVPDF